jgi:threonine aldolase
VLCGSEAFIRKARRLRKQVGGGMRQAGILAAAGIVALEEMTERMAEDHVRARQLAEALAPLPGIQIDPGSPHTNMIFLALDPARVRCSDAELEAELATRGVLIHPVAPRHLRLVTHYWIDEAAVAQAADAFAAVLH